MTRQERPSSVEDVALLLRESSGSVLVRGGGTKLDWGGRVSDPDLILETDDLNGILTHNPADMTASVRAGTPLAGLQQHLAENGQWLALDPPTADDGATVGGLLAAGDSGPSRLRYGGIRDLVIGVTLVLADGTVARSGGHVIKNVAGYDLAKIVHGSLGSLAVIGEVVVRLHPLPPTSATLAGSADAATAQAAALAIAAGPMEPAAVEWTSDGDSGRMLVRVDGSEQYVEASGARLATLLDEYGVSTDLLSENDAASAWRTHRSAVLGAENETVIRICTLPNGLERLVSQVHEIAEHGDLVPSIGSSVALGIHTVRLAGGHLDDHAKSLTDLRERALADGASVLLRSRDPALDDLVDVLGPPPSTAALLRRIKSQFDPRGRLAPGRFEPWY